MAPADIRNKRRLKDIVLHICTRGHEPRQVSIQQDQALGVAVKTRHDALYIADNVFTQQYPFQEVRLSGHVH